MVNFKNLLAGFVGTFVVVSALSVALPASAQLNDPEFTTAFNGILTTDGYTNATTEENFRPYDLITRGEFAKPASKLAAEELCLERDMTMACSFSDTAGYDYSLVPFITAACQMELVKGSNGMYYPNNAITKAEVLTVYSRALAAANGEAAPSEDVTPRWANHHRAMLAAGITNETDVNGLDRAITRYEAYLMVARLANATTLVCEGELDLSDLLADLFGDEDEDVVDDMDEEEETTTTTTVSDGMVMAMLSSSTPNGETVPGRSTIEVAAFDFTADGDDVQLETIVLERFGLGSDDVLDELTLLVNGEVVTKSRSLNSDQQATFSFNPEVTVEAGQTVTVVVLATIGDADDVSNEEFAVGLVDFETNGDEDTSNLPLRANSFEVAGTNAALVKVTADGNLSDVELGEQGAEIASFTIENDSEDAVYITTITLEDDESEIEDSAENFVLEFNGQEVAMVASVSDKYLTFTLTTPVMIDENEEEDFKVLADIIAGAGEQINLIIDESIYVRGYDERYGFGLAVEATYTPAAIDINAGELTFVELDIDRDEVRSDSDDVVIAAFEVNVNAGQDLSLEDISFNVRANNPGAFGAANSANSLLAHFDEVQLIVTVDGSRRTYDLDTDDNGGNFEAFDDDLGIFLPEGSTITITLEVDTINVFPGSSFGEDFEVFLNVAQDVEIIENDDDERVTDIVPSSMTFDTLEFVDSTVDVNSINLTDVDVVKGAENVDVLKFEISADDVSSVLFEGITLQGSVSTATGASIPANGNFGGASSNINQDYITAIRLWMRTSAGYELLEAEGGFDFNNGVITLDSFDEVIIDRASDMEFLVTVDIADSDVIAGRGFSFVATQFDIEDDNNVQLTVTGPRTSTRTVLITDAGTLTINVDTSEEDLDDAKYVLGGSDRNDAPYVAAFEFTAENESIDIEDLTITATVNGAGDFSQSVAEIALFDEDGNFIDSEIVNGNTVNFNNINLIIEEGSQLVFVKVITDIIGRNQNGDVVNDVTFALSVSNVDGVDSGDAVTPINAGGNSVEFSVVPVKFSDNVEFVQSANGVSVPATFSNETARTNLNLAILKLTADSWDNVDRADGSQLELLVDELSFEVSATAGYLNYEIRRAGESSEYYTGVQVGNVVTFDLSGANLETREFVGGEVGYFQVRADADIGASNNQLTFGNLNGGGSYEPINYRASDSNLIYTELRIGNDLLESEEPTVSN